MLLKEYDYYGTRLPRIPVQIERELKMKLLMIPEKRQRKKDNEKNLDRFIPGTRCKAISSQDNDWHFGIVINVCGPKAIRIEFTDGNKDFINGKIEKTENTCKFIAYSIGFNHEMFLMKVSEHKKQFNDPNAFYSGEEVVDLGNVMIIDCSERGSRSSSRESRKHERQKGKKRRERSRSRKREKKHRSRSRESSPRFDKKEKE